MIDKVKEKIEENKKDRSNYKEYIKSFCESEKAQEYYKDNSDFKKMMKKYLSQKNEEDEY